MSGESRHERPDDPFQVRIHPHGRVVSADAGRPVLDAVLAAGLNLPHSCKSGHCSSCRARLVSGRIRYPHGRPLGLTEDEARQGYVLLCQARPESDLSIEARLVERVGEVEIKTLPCRIARLRRLAPDVMQVFLRLPAVEPLRFRPGQYLDVLLEGGRRRSFSIASPPREDALIELHVRHAPGGDFTGRLFDGRLSEGSLLRIEGPLGQLVYREGPSPVILIGGGTGFAPLKSILRHELERGMPREVHFYWGARTAADVYEDDLVSSWVRECPNLRYTAVLSAASQVQREHHRLGWVHEAVLADHPGLESFEIYAAGPPEMIGAIRTLFPSHGAAEDRLYFDSFDYAPDSKASSSDRA